MKNSEDIFGKKHSTITETKITIPGPEQYSNEYEVREKEVQNDVSRPFENMAESEPSVMDDY